MQSLLKPHRQLIHEGVITESKSRKMHFWLFNDIFVHVPDNKAKNKANLTKPKYQVCCSFLTCEMFRYFWSFSIYLCFLVI
jgi:hypothetical protein